MVVSLDGGRYINITIRKNDNGIYEYYNNGILIGIYDKNVMKDSKIMLIDLEKRNTIENELSAQSKDEIKQIIDEVKQKIDQMSLEDIEDEVSDNKVIGKYLEEIGIERRKVKSISVVEVKKDDKKSDSKIEDDEMTSNRVNNELANRANKQENNITNGDIVQEIDLDERATDVENFKKWLGNRLPEDAKKIAVICSDKMSKMKDERGQAIDVPTTQYGLAVISEDEKGKKIEPLKKYIPELEQNHSSGNNPREQQYQIETNGNVEKDAVLSEYRIGRKIIQLDKDHGDNFEVNIGAYSPNNNELVTTEMRGNQTLYATRTEVRRAAMGDKGGVYESANSYEEAEKHEKAGDIPDDLTYKEIDGNENTGHIHFTQQEFDESVKELMQDEDISSVFTEREVRDRMMKNVADRNKTENSENKMQTIEDIKKQTKTELEQDAMIYDRRNL